MSGPGTPHFSHSSSGFCFVPHCLFRLIWTPLVHRLHRLLSRAPAAIAPRCSPIADHCMSESHKIINTVSGWRVSQACDRCRMKKIKCDGGTPCNKCLSIGFDCTTSDKLSRRAFPKGYTVNLEKRIAELEEENAALKAQMGPVATAGLLPPLPGALAAPASAIKPKPEPSNAVTTLISNLKNIPINNPIDQIFNLDQNGIIIGNDNLNFESQFNHMLINLNLPFLKITNSHNYLTNDPDSYLYHPSYSSYNGFHNKDLGLIYNPLTVDGRSLRLDSLINTLLPRDVYDLFIKLINNLKKTFSSKKELDVVVVHFFLNFNTFVPILDYTDFTKRYDALHTMYPFMFTYDDATINGFNLTNDYNVVNEHLIVVIQIYAMILMTDPTLNLNLLLNHAFPNYAYLFRMDRHKNESIIKSLYDFLPYLNAFHCSITLLQTYLLLFYYSLLTNNKEKSLVLSAMINAYMGILGINLNAKSLFFNDLSLSLQQRRDRVKIFWSFKILLKCFNLKFGFKPSINTTVINPVTIDQYYRLTPEKLSSLLDTTSGNSVDVLFQTLLKPSVEFLNLLNIIIPSSFSPNYYQYLKNEKPPGHDLPQNQRRPQSSNLDWILNDDDGDGNDGNLNYNYTQFLTIDTNLSNWRYSLREKSIDLAPLHTHMGLPLTSEGTSKNLYERITFDGDLIATHGISEEGKQIFSQIGLPDASTAAQLIRMQLNMHYLLIRSLNYLNFVIERELTPGYYVKIANISRETLAYFVLMFEHLTHTMDEPMINHGDGFDNSLFTDSKKMLSLSFPAESGIHVEDEGFIINDFSAKRRKVDVPRGTATSEFSKEIPSCPFNGMLNGLSLTIVNFKKSIVLQMLYLLICTLKVAKKGGVMSNDTISVLNQSINLFIKVFINYRPNANKNTKVRKVKEDDLFKKIINDELKEEFLSSKNVESDDDDDDENEIDIDWDDEEMDEDLKYLKILKYIKYKTSHLHEKYMNRRRSSSEHAQTFTGPKAESQSQNEGAMNGDSRVAHHAPLAETRDAVNGFPQFNLGHGHIFPGGGLGKVLSFSTLDFIVPHQKTEAGQSEAVASELMNIKRGNRAYPSPWQNTVSDAATSTMNP